MACLRTSPIRIGSSLIVAAWLGAAAVPVARAQPVTSARPATSDCLACAATRQATAAEWEQAMALTSAMKASAATAAPTVTTRGAARDPRSSLERMREIADRAYGEDLAHLSTLATKIDADAQTYLSACYVRYLPIFVEGAAPRPGPRGSRPRSAPSSPVASGPLATLPPEAPIRPVFEMWSGAPAFAWNETWSTLGLAGGQPSALCQGIWRDLSTGSDAIKSALDVIQADARAHDVYPGVMRELFESYGLVPQR